MLREVEMAVGDKDKAAARALVKLGILTKDEIGEWLEGLEEIDYEEGLLGLLEDEGRITLAQRKKAEKAVSSAAAAPAAAEAPAPAAEEKAAEPARKARREPEAKPAAGKAARAEEGKAGREKPSARKGQDLPSARGGGRKALIIGAAAVLLLAAAGVGFLVLGRGGNGGGGGGGGGKPEGGKSGGGSGGGEGTGEPTAVGPGGGKSPSGAKTPEKRVRVDSLSFRFRDRTRILYDVTTETTNTASAEKLQTKEEQNLFINCLGQNDGKQMTCVEHITSTTTLRGAKDPEKSGLNYIEFLLVDGDGSTESERRMGSLPLAWALAEPRFPKDGKILDGTWTLDMDTKEGRFEFEYVLGGTETVEAGSTSRSCRKLRVNARFPGGAPPSSFALRKAQAEIWFDAAEGVIAKSLSHLETAAADAEETAPPLVATTVTRNLQGVDPLESKELKSVSQASDFYFEILGLIEGKKYNKAYKMLDEPELETKYFVMVPDLMRRVPGVRMSLQAQLAMRERERKTFRDIAWRRPEHGPAMVTSMPNMPTSKERKLDLAGKPAPDWISAEIKTKDKPTLLYVGCSWLGASYTAMPAIKDIAKNMKDKVDVCGIVDAKDFGERIRFIMGCGNLNHRVKFVDENELRKFNLAGVPAFFVIDRSGTVKYACVGFLPETTRKEIEAALQG